ncbi:MAG: heavy metal translocating P-type ATPase metal-binding domain-containing protein [Flavobacteriaceae bacterium]|nr:heavy metal translocating P-type ATPase metal-binding domain-containing protein [Flavobacteriaceae bacterium]
MKQADCYHCGTPCEVTTIHFDDKTFCCRGCQTVYALFSENNLTYYYEMEANPGAKPGVENPTFEYLKNPDIVAKLIDFEDENQQVVTLYIPHIHCSSCVWILEHLDKLNKNILQARVNFASKKVTFRYKHTGISLYELVSLLDQIAYTPYISLDDNQKKKPKSAKEPLYQLALAGFAFGNVMLLSFPEYFEVDEFWLDKFKPFFRWLMFIYAVPVLIYGAKNFFISAYKGLKNGFLNIDVPIALGLVALFVQSSFDIFFDKGSGYFDTFTGLVFFMLLGRMFQRKTYDFLSFDRDYKSYFPLAVTRINPNSQDEESVSLQDIQKEDRLLIKNNELIPVDGILISSDAAIDYSFVNGESDAVNKKTGDKIYAGGRQVAGAIEMIALNSVSQSYLTQLWEQQTFAKDKYHSYEALTDKISQYFTPSIIALACLGGLYWWWAAPENALRVFIAVLIVACPCALALATPFTLGNMIRIFGKNQFYLKNTLVIERLSKIDTLVFDKTGTLTIPRKSSINYYGAQLSEKEISLLSASLRQSNHPLSRELYSVLKQNDIEPIAYFSEKAGLGFEVENGVLQMKVGSKKFTQPNEATEPTNTAVYVSANGQHRGYFTFKHFYRKGIKKLLKKLAKKYQLIVLSGDKESSLIQLEKYLPHHTGVFMEQNPIDKLQKIENLQNQNKKVAMLGDGLNDAGALTQSDVGIAISENTNYFSPACDAILKADHLHRLDTYLKASRQAMHILKFCFLVSIAYNIVGLTFALSGLLSPLLAAILMPASSISIVALSTILTNLLSRKLRLTSSH